MIFKKQIDIGYYIVGNNLNNYIFDEKNKILYNREADTLFLSESCSDEDIESFWTKDYPKWSYERWEREVKKYRELCDNIMSNLELKEIIQILEKVSLEKLIKSSSSLRHIIKKGKFKIPSDIEILEQFKYSTEYLRGKKIVINARKIVKDILKRYNGNFECEEYEIYIYIKRKDNNKVYLHAETWRGGDGLERSGTVDIDQIPENLVIELTGMFQNLLYDVLYSMMFALYKAKLLKFTYLGI